MEWISSELPLLKCLKLQKCKPNSNNLHLICHHVALLNLYGARPLNSLCHCWSPLYIKCKKCIIIVVTQEICFSLYVKEEWDRSISIVTKYGLDDHGVQHLLGTKIFLFFITSRPVLKPTQFPTHCIQGVMVTDLTSHMYNLHCMLKYKNNFIFTLHLWEPYQTSWAN
jgi:hypothetical protein